MWKKEETFWKNMWISFLDIKKRCWLFTFGSCWLWDSSGGWRITWSNRWFFFTVDEVEVETSLADLAKMSRAAWWDFNSGLEELVASVTFADAFDCRLSCSGTHADIGPGIGNVDNMLWTFYLFILFNCTVPKKNSSSAYQVRKASKPASRPGPKPLALAW